jgi:hypothetical protein
VTLLVAFSARHTYANQLGAELVGYSDSLFGPRPMVSEVETLIDDGIDLNGTALAGALARMQQHVLDDEGSCA